VYKHAVIVRNETFSKVPKFMTRIVNALASSGAADGTVEEGYRFIRKFYKPPKKKDLPLPDASAAELSITRSSSQMDYDSVTGKDLVHSVCYVKFAIRDTNHFITTFGKSKAFKCSSHNIPDGVIGMDHEPSIKIRIGCKIALVSMSLYGHVF
jgi:hypothetical protein